MDTSKFDDVAVVVPAFNEENKVLETISGLEYFFQNIVVIDDGSSDRTTELAKSTKHTVLTHPINLGQGAALQTGITKALENESIKYILTFDADGQHSVSSAVSMIEALKASDCNIMLGSRFLETEALNMPAKKKIILRLGILFTRFDSGLKVTDTHNGLRVMDRNFASSLKINHAGMAHASEILNHIRNVNAKWQEFPAQIYYTEYSISKGQSIFNAINILTEMIYK